ncbi:MAG: hypothetical protein ACYC7L_01135 [Nitrospirota bacterium]
MPKIEIVSLRFNLDKEDDNRLFALLQKRADTGKRNEFLKQLLCDALTAGVAGDKTKTRQTRKPPREQFEPAADQPAQEAQEPAQTSAPGPESGPRTAAHGQTNGPDPGGASSTAEPDREAASLVGSFVQ